MENKNYALPKPFETDFLTVISNANVRPSFVIFWVAHGSWSRCGLRHPILHSNIFFHMKLFATIILSWNSLKCILWYLLELSDPFIKNENSVLPIWIEDNFQQKIYFCLLKMRSIFFKEGKYNFSKNSRFFLLYFLKKDDRPKADPGLRLPTLP